MKTRPLFHGTRYWPFLSLLGILLFYSAYINAQCFNTVQFPAEEIPVTTFSGDVTMISESSEAGHFCVIKDLIVGISYTFTSSNPDDFITIRIEGGTSADPPISSGPSPHTFSATSHILEVHINLTSPPCGTENVPRTTTITCLDGFPEPPKTGINTTDPAATLDVVGRLKISDDITSPEAGMIRFNSNTMDFEGYNGEKWLSLTRSASTWGNLPAAVGVEDAKLTANDGADGDNFGYSVAISGDYAIIGAYADNVGGNTDQGSAYVFARSGTSWTQQTKLTANDGGSYDEFGYSVAISGNHAIIGARNYEILDDTYQGAAYIFVPSSTISNVWTQQAKLTANDNNESFDFFGRSVAISGDYAIITDFREQVNNNSDQGAAYIFVRAGTSWAREAKLTANDGANNDRFGISVAISGDDVIIGAYQDDVSTNNNQGAAYFFCKKQ